MLVYYYEELRKITAMNKNNKQILILISWIAVLLWMILIFNLSSQTADQSNKLSKGITSMIAEAIASIFPGDSFDIGIFHYLIRKNAHFIAYLVLGLLEMNALCRSGFKGMKACVTAFVICVLFALSDEFHQLYVPGRSGQALDVLIDSAGSDIGIRSYIFIKRNR